MIRTLAAEQGVLQRNIGQEFDLILRATQLRLRGLVAKFPTLAALARGEFSFFAAEATSERSFSYSGASSASCAAA